MNAARRRIALVMAGVLAVVGAISGAVIPGFTAQAADANQFEAGFIITDQNFFDPDAMSVADIQGFLNAKVPTCRSTDASLPCLKNYSQTTTTVAATPMCGQYNGAANESAATIIWKVAQSCGVSPRTIIVTLEKEQGLVTSTAPAARAYRSAMGAGCPDTAACDSNYYGFFNQVHYGAYLFKRYTMPPGTGPGTPYYSSYTNYWPGTTAAVKYSPGDCGTKSVFIQNMATHVLYTYTPYTPDDAALANLYGTGDGCSSYGNRNFWRLWSDWFGSPTNNNSPYGAITSSSTTEGAFSVHGWGVDPDGAADSNTALTVQITVDGVLKQTLTAGSSDASLSYLYVYYGTLHAFSASFSGIAPGPHRVCAIGLNQGSRGSDRVLECVTIVVAWCGTTVTCPDASDRIAGEDRYETSALVADQAYPDGASVAYISTGQGFPDALSGAPAAATSGGPLLLTPRDSLAPAVSAEIIKLGVKRIIVLGGPTTVSPSVETALDGLVGEANVSRIAGADRYQTSRMVATSGVFSDLSTVYVATGRNFPDALSGGAAAAATHHPLILVDGSAATIDEPTRQLLAGATNVVIVGGPPSVSTGIESAIRALPGVTVTRFGGDDRFQTSTLLAASVHPAGSVAIAYLSTGIVFPDGLSGAVIAAVQQVPLMLTQTNCIPDDVVDALETFSTDKIVLLGGPTTVGTAVQSLDMC
jgi:putative cell wall-binding protein